MSLHLANLSAGVRKDELERVFRRFGRCTVQLKDSYGFVVYDFRGDAEKALRTLKGRKICGKPIYLSWSNKQPKPLQRFARAARSHDMRYGRNFERSDNYVGRSFSRSRGDYSVSDKQPDNGEGRHKSAEIRDDRGSFNHSSSRLACYNQSEEFVEEVGHVEPNQEDNSRWGAQVDDLQNEDEFDEQPGFDRYEPDCGDERGEEYENCGGRLVGSPSWQSPGRNRRVLSSNMRGPQTCFKCGVAGHKMRDCPFEDSFPGKSSHYLDHRHGDESKTKARVEDGGSESRSRGRLRPSSGNFGSGRRHETDSKPSYSETNGIDGRRSPVGNESKRNRRKAYNRKRRREREDQMVETLDNETVRSKSRSHRSMSRSIKSKSRSRSRSPSSSLFISLGQSLPSSPNKAEVNLNGSFDDAPSPQSKEVPTEVKQLFEPEVREENLPVASIAGLSLSGCTDNATTHQLKEITKERQLLEPDSKEETPTSTQYAEASLNGFFEDDQIPQSEKVVLEERQLLEPEHVQNFGPQKTDVPLQSEDMSSLGKVIDDKKPNQLHNDGDSDSTIPRVSSKVKVPCSSLLDEGDKDTAAENMAVGNLRETEELENANYLEITKPVESANNLDQKSRSKLHIGSHLSISAEELCRVLKHYGLKHPEEEQQHLDVEDYFGSGRLWPWEMIYYRRLKKGPISTENYARRVAQNKAFGITDKYIRSSSGWGELVEEQN